PARALGARRADAGTLTIAVPSAPGSWDQDYLAFDLVGLALNKNYYPYAIDYGVRSLRGAPVQNTSAVVPVYAESWKGSPDGKTWTLTMKRGVKFPSGNELTAQDVKWSKDRAFAAKANVAGVYSLIGLTRPSQVQVLDNYTIRFTQDYPSALTPHIQIISLYVFDSKLMRSKATSSDPWAKTWASQNPTSGGAYNVASIKPGAEIVLEANPEFPGSPKPSIQTVRLVITPSAANRRLQLEKGDVDLAIELSRRDILQLKGKQGVKVVTGPSNEFVFIAMDVNTAPLDDKRVRQALAHAIPYDAILSTVFDGDARKSTSIVPRDMPGNSAAGYPFSFNPGKAKSLLKAAGHGDGLELELVIDQGNPDRERIAILVQNALKQVGVDLKITPLDPATLNDRRAKKTIQMQIASGQYWVNDVQYQVGTSLLPGGFLNYSNFDQPEIGKLYTQVSKLADQKQRLAIFAQMQRILAQEVPWLMLGQPNFALPMRSNVNGWVQPVDNLFRLRYLRKS
ncbi:MAG: ABC transporter substrate-binding protein, partial [Actinobacteria bacterium]|nr:ABC transporter substrate-binding protein [Actinomycetota bacterium]